MSEFNFNSAVCTSAEQSRKLLALGLKKETADMWRGFLVGGETLVPTEDVDLYNFYVEPIPAWSLHRLLMMTTSKRKVMLIRCELDIYNVVIKRIEHEIKEGYFNKEYMEDE